MSLPCMILSTNQTKWQRGKVAIDMKFTDKHPYTVRLEENFQL